MSRLAETMLTLAVCAFVYALGHADGITWTLTTTREFDHIVPRWTMHGETQSYLRGLDVGWTMCEDDFNTTENDNVR